MHLNLLHFLQNNAGSQRPLSHRLHTDSLKASARPVQLFRCRCIIIDESVELISAYYAHFCSIHSCTHIKIKKSGYTKSRVARRKVSIGIKSVPQHSTSWFWVTFVLAPSLAVFGMRQLRSRDEHSPEGALWSIANLSHLGIRELQPLLPWLSCNTGKGWKPSMWA